MDSNSHRLANARVQVIKNEVVEGAMTKSPTIESIDLSLGGDDLAESGVGNSSNNAELSFESSLDLFESSASDLIPAAYSKEVNELIGMATPTNANLRKEILTEEAVDDSDTESAADSDILEMKATASAEAAAVGIEGDADSSLEFCVTLDELEAKRRHSQHTSDSEIIKDESLENIKNATSTVLPKEAQFELDSADDNNLVAPGTSTMRPTVECPEPDLSDNASLPQGTTEEIQEEDEISVDDSDSSNMTNTFVKASPVVVSQEILKNESEVNDRVRDAPSEDVTTAQTSEDISADVKPVEASKLFDEDHSKETAGAATEEMKSSEVPTALSNLFADKASVGGGGSSERSDIAFFETLSSIEDNTTASGADAAAAGIALGVVEVEEIQDITGAADHIPVDAASEVLSDDTRSSTRSLSLSMRTCRSVSVEATIKDKIMDAWIPSAKIRSHLREVARLGAVGRANVSLAELSLPVVMRSDHLGDPVRILMAKHAQQTGEGVGRDCGPAAPILGEMLRHDNGATKSSKPISTNDVEQTVDGLQTLIEAKAYRSAIELTGRLLTQMGYPTATTSGAVVTVEHSPESLELWNVRLSLLVFVEEYALADSEIQNFHNSFDSPDLYYHFYPEYFPGRTGSMVPFSLRLLSARIAFHIGRPHLSLKMFFSLLQTIDLMIESPIEAVLEACLSEEEVSDVFSTSTAHVSTSSTAEAPNYGTDNNDGPGSQNDTNHDVDDLRQKKSIFDKIWKRRRQQVMQLVSSVLLSMRNYEVVIQVLLQIRSLQQEEDQRVKTDDLKFLYYSQQLAELLSLIGLTCLEIGSIPTAGKYFKEAAEVLVDQQQSLDDSISSEHSLLSFNRAFNSICTLQQDCMTQASNIFKSMADVQPNNYVAVNNMAVCSLYDGALSTSIDILENLVFKESFLNETVVCNLSTLYELRSSRAWADKLRLLTFVSEHTSDGFNTACMKIEP